MKTILNNPRVTEKASFASEKNAYTFDVSPFSNKTEVKKAIFALYKVKPIKINILPVPRKKIFARGKSGVKGGGKKAIAYLKAGDKIEFL